MMDESADRATATFGDVDVGEVFQSEDGRWYVKCLEDPFRETSSPRIGVAASADGGQPERTREVDPSVGEYWDVDPRTGEDEIQRKFDDDAPVHRPGVRSW